LKKKKLILALKISGAILLLILALMLAFMLWLRSAHAEKTLARLLTDSLAEQGIVLEMQSFSGPLPGQLHIKGLALSDASGTWFSAKELNIQAHLPSLFLRKLHFTLVQLEDPEFNRLPELPGSVDDIPYDTQNDATGISLPLPVSIEFEAIRLADGKIAQAVLDMATGSKNTPALPLNSMSLNVSGNAYLTGYGFTADLDAALLYPDETGFTVSLHSVPGKAALYSGKINPAEDYLLLRLSAREGQGGVLAGLAGNADIPEYNLLIEGSGNPKNWQGSLSFTAGEEKNRLLKLNGSFNFSSDDPEVDFVRILDTTLTAKAQFEAEGGPATPQELRMLLTPSVHIDVRASKDEEKLGIEALRCENADWLLALTDFSADFTQKETSILRGKLQTLLKNSKLLNNLSQGQADKSFDFVETIQLDTDILAQIRQNTPVTEALFGLQGQALAALGGERLEFDYNLEADFANTLLKLTSFRLAGMGITALAHGNMDFNSKSLSVAAGANSEQNALWRTLAARLLKSEDILPDGQLSLNLKLQSDELLLDGKNSASLHVEGRKMLWPASVPQGILAEQFKLDAALAGSGKNYNLTLQTLESGLLSLKGKAELKNMDTLDSSFTLSLASLTPLLTGSGITEVNSSAGSGFVATIQTSGTLERLKILAKIRSGNLRTASNMLLSNINSSISAEKLNHKILGQAELAFATNPGGPITLNTNWEVNSGRDNSLIADLRKLKLKMPGILLQTDLEYEDNAAKNKTALTGQSKLEIESWHSISQLSGMRILGSSANLEIKLKTEAAGQSLRASWKLGKFGLAFDGKGNQSIHDAVFKMDSATGTLDIANLFKEPRITMTAVMGHGNTGNFAWRSGQASINSSQKKGAFSVTLQGWRRNAAPGSSGTERLALNGTFDPENLLFTLDDFVVRSTDNTHKIQLNEPVALNFSQGLSLPKLNLMLSAPKSSRQPGEQAGIITGSILASAEISKTGTELKLKIKDAPVKIVSLFTAASLPEGTLSLDVNLLKRGQKLSGNILAESSLLPAVSEAKYGEGQQAIVQNIAKSADLSEPCPYLFTLSAGFGQTPSAVFPKLARQDGIIRLTGKGKSFYADAPQGSQDGSLEFDLPFSSNNDKFIKFEPTVPMGMRVKWQGAFEPLWQLLSLGDRSFSGYGQVDLMLIGDLQNPRYRGSAYLLNGRYEDKVIGLLLNNITMEARGNSRKLNLLLSAEDGLGGKLALQGHLNPPEDNRRQRLIDGINSLNQPIFAVRGQISHLRPLHRDDLSLQLSGILGLNGPLNAPEISADIEVEHGEFMLASMSGGSITTLELYDANEDEEPQKAYFGPTLNARLSIPAHFFIRGYGLDSEWAGEMSATGSLDQPELIGRIRPVRGYFNVLSKPFAFSGGDISLSGGKKINPVLNLELSNIGQNLTAFANITGTATKPVLTFSSIPPLPKDQILAEVLFGKNAASLSQYEAIQLASGLNELSGGKSLDLLGSARKTLGVDMLRINGGSSGSQQRNTYGTIGGEDKSRASSTADDDSALPRLEAGKYITGNIYVGVEQGVAENSTGVRVEVELKNNLTLQARTTTESSDVGIGWKKDY
jgi:translocation and assembly module TamB